MVSWFIQYMMGFLATRTEMQSDQQFPCSPAPYQLNSATFSQIQKGPIAVPGQFRTDLVILESFNRCLSVWQNTDIPIFIAPIYILLQMPQWYLLLPRMLWCIVKVWSCIPKAGTEVHTQIMVHTKLIHNTSTTCHQSCAACFYQWMFRFNGPQAAKHHIIYDTNPTTAT
jgi:hypothetical protein